MRGEIETMLEMTDEWLESVRDNFFNGFYDEPEKKKEEKPVSEETK